LRSAQASEQAPQPMQRVVSISSPWGVWGSLAGFDMSSGGSSRAAAPRLGGDIDRVGRCHRTPFGRAQPRGRRGKAK
jgi:hypothetical protein